MPPSGLRFRRSGPLGTAEPFRLRREQGRRSASGYRHTLMANGEATEASGDRTERSGDPAFSRGPTIPSNCLAVPSNCHAAPTDCQTT
jgi:hypothetical protein